MPLVNPSSGSSLPILNDGQIFVGNNVNQATAVTPSGDATINDTGVISLTNASVTGQTLTGLGAGSNTAITSSNTILNGMANLQNQITSNRASPPPSSAYEKNPFFMDDFFYQNGANGPIDTAKWGVYNSGSGAGITPVFNTSSITNGHPGVSQLVTATAGTSTSYSAIYTEQRGINFDSTLGSHDLTWIAKLKAAPVAGDDFVLTLGFIEQILWSQQDYGIAFVANRGNGTTNAATHWQCATFAGNNSTSATFVDSGIAFDTNWHKFRITVHATTGHAIFYIDGVQVANISTNIPSNSQGTAIGCSVDNNSNAGTTSHGIYLDYVYMVNNLNTSR